MWRDAHRVVTEGAIAMVDSYALVSSMVAVTPVDLAFWRTRRIDAPAVHNV